MAHVILLRPNENNHFDVLVHRRGAKSKDPHTLGVPGGSYEKNERRHTKHVALREFVEEAGGSNEENEKHCETNYVPSLKRAAYIPKSLLRVRHPIQHGKSNSFYYVVVLSEVVDGKAYIEHWSPCPEKEWEKEVDMEYGVRGYKWVSWKHLRKVAKGKFKIDEMRCCWWFQDFIKRYGGQVEKKALCSWTEKLIPTK